ncbi:MAG: E2 domain-containing protein [Dokdonella sp.]
MSEALDHLKAVASEFRATVTSENSDSFIVRFEVVRADEAVEVFHLRVVDGTVNEAIPKVFECEPQRLPTFCLERHIVGTGSFCLSWNPGEPSEVLDAETARAFWSRVDRFLQCQLTASALRKWPAQRNARAHGKAAGYQNIAENLAAQLGPNALRDLRVSKFTVQRVVTRGKVRLELHRDGQRVARIAINGSLISTMTRCLCDESARTRVSIGECHDHAEVVADLIRALYLWRETHSEFIRTIVAGGSHCCGTLDVCEIRRAGAALSTPALPIHLEAGNGG